MLAPLLHSDVVSYLMMSKANQSRALLLVIQECSSCISLMVDSRYVERW